MNRIGFFEKVSFEQFKKDWYKTFEDNEKYNSKTDEELQEIYDNIKLPERKTSGSAGYDFHIPFDCVVPINSNITIPTGIRCYMEDGWVLKEYPRSGLGFKTGIHMANTCGIIDADYYNAENEGHIMIKLVNDSSLAKMVRFESGNAFCQGVFVPFGVTYDDSVNEKRTGGFGSTSR